MRDFVRHYVNDMDESMVQNCIFCGEVITDYRNACWPSGQSAPKGFNAGEVFVSKGSPTISKTSLVKAEPYKNCTDN